MGGIRSFGLVICVLMVLMAYLKQTIPRGKTTFLMKAIVSLYILLSIIFAVKEMSWKGLERLLNSSYTHNDTIFEQSADLMEEGLKEEFMRYLQSVELNAQIYSVSVIGELDEFKISKVQIFGPDAEIAQKLLAGRYKIGLNLIEVVDE